MSTLVLYTCIIFGIFNIFSLVILSYTFRKPKSFSRYLITLCNIGVSIDTCLYINNSSIFLNSFSDWVQKFLLDTIGMGFINKNEYTDYAFSLITIYCIYILIFIFESAFTPSNIKYNLRVYKSKIGRSKPDKKQHVLKNTSTIISIITTVITTLIALFNFFNKK
ncbi:MAG: hypothetical protein N3B21_14965 [Clostridia bacterium]|nr:hypothetical protein [Clostridia bacterium]